MALKQCRIYADKKGPGLSELCEQYAVNDEFSEALKSALSDLKIQ